MIEFNVMLTIKGVVMNKAESIQYLNQIRPYINLKAICEDYNKRGNPPIDYNNLRAVLNGVSESRLSESRINQFVEYLFSDLYIDTFKMNQTNNETRKTTVSNIILSYAEEISQAIIKELNNAI